MTKFTRHCSFFVCSVQSLQGAPKNNPQGKIRYLWNCCRFFR